MLIGKDYKIEADSLNVTLYERRITKKGKEYWKAIGFFSRFGNALKSLVDLRVRGTGLRDFNMVCQKQDELYKLIDSLKVSSQGVKK